MLGWSKKFLGIQRLDARSPVGRYFLIEVPYSCYLTDSFILMSIHKRGVGRIYSQSRGRGPRKIFWGGAPDPNLFLFRPSNKKILAAPLPTSLSEQAILQIKIGCCENKDKTVEPTFLGGDLLEVRRNGHGLFLILRINLSVFPR